MSNEIATGPTPAGDWLFQADGQVFGPVTGARLIELLSAGSVGPATQVARDGGPWQSLESVPQFLVDVKKAQARGRVEAEASAARARARRRGAVRWAGAAIAVALAVVAGVRVASHFAAGHAWGSRTALLDDLGAPITMGAVLVRGGEQPRGGEEIEVPVGPRRRPPRGDERPRHLGTPAGAPQRRAAPSDGLVVAQYDPARIGEVVARERASLTACVREEARRSPELRGEIPIEFAVGNDGKVSALWIQDPRFRSGALHECILRKLREWSFDPFPGERPVVSLAFLVGPP
jgi:hypothetical protein